MGTQNSSIAVTGGTGYVGRFVVKQLMQQGYRVRVLNRQATTPAGFAASPEWLHGDLTHSDTRPELLDRLLFGQQALVHCALSHEPGRYRGGEGDTPEQFWQDNLLPSIALLEAALRMGVQRVIFLSSRAVLDGVAGKDRLLADDEPPRPTTHYGALKAAEEALSAQYSQHTELTVSCLRLTGVYGVSYPLARSKWFDQLQRAIAGEPPAAPRSGTEVHGDDVAAAVALILNAEVGRVNGQVFNCSDLVISRRQLITTAQKYCKEPLQLPDPSAAPDILMACVGLARLGWHPGGWAQFERTVQQLTRGAKTQT